MSLLFKQLRVHQIFGANTDVGKTILTTALVRASAARETPTFYLKPVSTGPPEEADDEHIKRYAGTGRNLIHTDCLFRYGEPLSPHLAIKMDAEARGAEVSIPSDGTLVKAVASHIRSCAARAGQHAHMYVETAGGVHSPTLSGSTQADGYRPLFLPTILIGDSKLGGISSTISSYESLLLRGYIVDAILLFRDDYYRNWEYLQSYFVEKGVNVTGIDPPPPRLEDKKHNYASTQAYYEQIAPSNKQGPMFDVLTHLDDCHKRRIEELDSMPRRTLDSIWWPFMQHGLFEHEKDVTVIDSATSDFFSIYNGHSPTPSSTGSLLEPQFDGSASWWTQTLGHSHPSLTLAAARAAGRYGHVMFPQATHLPALKLAETLLQGPGKGWASRAYFSDDGSTGMEIALKMALRAYTKRHGQALDNQSKKNLGIIGLKGSYHGDTIGAMDACEEGVYTCEWHDAKGYWFDPPSVSIRKGQPCLSVPHEILGSDKPGCHLIEDKSLSHIYDVPERLDSPLAKTYKDYIKKTLDALRQGPRKVNFAALVLEPLVMGAGGMVFVDPLFQRCMIDVVRGSSEPSASADWSGVPVIFDEVFVGLHRLGLQSCGPLLGANPDISVNAKILTGGLVPLAVTLASDSIFQAFLSQNKTEALLHGHSYTAHAVGCEVANETLKIIESLEYTEPWKAAKKSWAQLDGQVKTQVWSLWDPTFVKAISGLDIVQETMTLGTVLAVKISDPKGGYASDSARALLESIKTGLSNQSLSPAPGGAPFGIHYRTLGDVAYFMTSLNTSPDTIRAVEDRIWRTLNQAR